MDATYMKEDLMENIKPVDGNLDMKKAEEGFPFVQN